jgi:lipopolysaccharide export system permease protein
MKKIIENYDIEKYKNQIKNFINKPLLPFILYKMLIKSFLYWYFIAQGLFIIIILIFDFFLKVNESYTDPHLQFTIIDILVITFSLTPKAMWLTMPIAIMFGVTMSLSSFYQHNELIAIFTSGISIYKFVLPLIIFTFFLSIFMIFMDSFIVIPSYRYRENLYEFLAKKEKEERDITIKGENNYFWNVEKFVSSNNMLKNIILLKINKDYKIIFRIDASSAIYTNEGWLFSSGTIKEWDDQGILKSEIKFYKKVINDLKEKPSVFKNVFKKSDYDIDKMTIIEAFNRINLLKKLNIDYNDELTKFYKKFSFPFTLLIVCLFAIGVSTISQKNIIILALFFSIGLAIIYYVMDMILVVLASVGKIFPILGAWLPIAIFIPISIVLVKKSKT